MPMYVLFLTRGRLGWDDLVNRCNIIALVTVQYIMDFERINVQGTKYGVVKNVIYAFVVLCICSAMLVYQITTEVPSLAYSTHILNVSHQIFHIYGIDILSRSSIVDLLANLRSMCSNLTVWYSLDISPSLLSFYPIEDNVPCSLKTYSRCWRTESSSGRTNGTQVHSVVFLDLKRTL